MAVKKVYAPAWRKLPKVQIYVCAVCGGQLEQVDPDEPASCWHDPAVRCSINPAHDGIITRGRWRKYGPILEAEQVTAAYPWLKQEPTLSREELRQRLAENVELLRGDPEFEGFD